MTYYKKIGKYIYCDLANPERRIINKKGDLLGEIGFSHAWKKYVFEPVSGVFFDSECLMDIAKYLLTL